MKAIPDTSWLSQRLRTPELMDQPGLDNARHTGALSGLERLNRWSYSAEILWPEVKRLLSKGRAKIRILDIAAGAGDVPIALWRRAHQLGYSIEIHGWDKSCVAIEHARHHAAEQEAAVHFHEADALQTALPRDFDVVISSLFLHHLSESEAIDLLRRMKHVARRMLMINDLERSGPGYLLAWVAPRVLTRSDVVWTDALRSVAAAFTRREARLLAQAAGLTNASVVSRWPFRFLLRWEPS